MDFLDLFFAKNRLWFDRKKRVKKIAFLNQWPALLTLLSFGASLVLGDAKKQVVYFSEEAAGQALRSEEISSALIKVQSDLNLLMLGWSLQDKSIYFRALSSMREMQSRWEDAPLDLGQDLKLDLGPKLEKMIQVVKSSGPQGGKADLARVAEMSMQLQGELVKGLDQSNEKRQGWFISLSQSIGRLGVWTLILFGVVSFSIYLLFKMLRNLKRAERDLDQKQNFLKVLMSSIDEGILLMDSHNRVLVANKRARDLLNIPSQMPKNTLLEDIFPELMMEKKESAKLYQMIRQGEGLINLQVRVESNEECWVSINSTLLPSRGERKAYILRLRNVTSTMKASERAKAQSDKIKKEQLNWPQWER